MAHELAWHHGSAGAEIAQMRALANVADRAFYQAVARQAERRHDYLRGLDTASRYLEAPRRPSGACSLEAAGSETSAY